MIPLTQVNIKSPTTGILSYHSSMSLSCIIPAYNEATRISAVLDIVTRCPLITEVIVIDDCSADLTGEVVKQYLGVTLLAHAENQGKSSSVYDGIQASTGDLLLFLDADLENLTVVDLENVIRPILNNTADITISLRGNAPLLWKVVGLDYISGERCFRKSFLDDCVEQIKFLRGFALEVFLNDRIIEQQLRIQIVKWPKVSSPFKRKLWGVHVDFFIMGLTILREISAVRVLKQIRKMQHLVI